MPTLNSLHPRFLLFDARKHSLLRAGNPTAQRTTDREDANILLAVHDMRVEVGQLLLPDSGLLLGKRVLGTGFSAVMDTKSDLFYPETATTLSQRSVESALEVLMSMARP